MRLILASNSPRRKDLLGRLHIPFEVRALPVRELGPDDAPATELPKLNAELKAQAVAEAFPEFPVLGADTVIVFGERIIGKPRDLAEARRTLLELAGKTHAVVTGLALLRKCDGVHEVWSERTEVTFRSFDEAVADRYLSLVDVLDKAGSYALQEHGELLISSVSGDADNVVGLPLAELRRRLERIGCMADPAGPPFTRG